MNEMMDQYDLTSFVLWWWLGGWIFKGPYQCVCSLLSNSVYFTFLQTILECIRHIFESLDVCFLLVEAAIGFHSFQYNMKIN